VVIAPRRADETDVVPSLAQRALVPRTDLLLDESLNSFCVGAGSGPKGGTD
jgi:hypothetical protein